MFEAKKESEKRTTQFLDRRPPPSSARAKYVRKIPTPAVANRKNTYTNTFANSSGNSGGGGNHGDSAISVKNQRTAHVHQGGFLSGTHPMLDRNAHKSSSSNSMASSSPFSKMSHVNSELIRRPLKERIIHLLAVRPFKKPELLSRINRGEYFFGILT